MGKERVEILIDGGKATAAPPLGPAIGPLGVNIGKVVADINAKTQSFKGMQVPVKVVVDTDSKEFTISIGTPPTSQLVIKESGVQKGSGSPNTEFVADLKMEQIIKIAKMKETSLLGKSAKEQVKEVLGTCRSMGVMVEGKKAQETLKDVQSGMYDQKIASGKTEITAEEQKELEAERKKLQEEIKSKHDFFMKQAKGIVDSLAGKEKSEIRAKLKEAKIPMDIINELAPEEKKEAKK